MNLSYTVQFNLSDNLSLAVPYRTVLHWSTNCCWLDHLSIFNKYFKLSVKVFVNSTSSHLLFHSHFSSSTGGSDLWDTRMKETGGQTASDSNQVLETTHSVQNYKTPCSFYLEVPCCKHMNSQLLKCKTWMQVRLHEADREPICPVIPPGILKQGAELYVPAWNCEDNKDLCMMCMKSEWWHHT